MNIKNITTHIVPIGMISLFACAIHTFGFFHTLKWSLVSFLLIGLVALIISAIFGIGHSPQITRERIQRNKEKDKEYEESTIGKMNRGVWTDY